MKLQLHLAKKSFSCGLLACLTAITFSCNDNESPEPVVETEGTQAFFVSASGETAEYILTTDNLESGDLTIAGNGKELEMSGYRWIFNEDPSVAVGLIYNQGEPGIGLGYQIGSEGSLQSLGQFQISSRFTSYGFFDDYAITSVGGQTLVDENGNALLDENGNERSDGATFNFINFTNGLSLESKTIPTLNTIVEGQQVTFSGLVDFGNGEFLTGVVASSPKDPNATGGSSSGTVLYPDSCWVAALDENLNIKRVYRSNKLSYSSGRYRSQYYSQIEKDDEGNAYVFSGSYESTTTKPAGALRINEGATDFDASYYFNIQELSDNYRFRQVWHITEDYFLLEFYNETEITTHTPATQYAVVKMEDKTFAWVGGAFPSKESINATGQPMAYEGKIYFPVTVEGEFPAIYIIDPATATATKGATITASAVNAIGLLKHQE